MAEIIGVAASASQLAMACFSLMDVVKKIKGGTSALKRYHQQLQDLKSLSTCISENPLLQTPEVGVQTQAILSIINNNCLNSLLQKGRLLRTWGLLYREQDLVEIFVKLERQKANLSLVIEHIQSKALYQIQTDIQAMAEKRASTSSTNDRSTDLVSHSYEVRGHQGPSRAATFPTTAPGLGSINPALAGLLNAFVPQFQSDYTGHYDAPKPQQSHEPPSGSGPGMQWNNLVAGPGAEQENRRVFIMDTELSQEVAKSKLTPCIFNNQIKLGSGDQINCHDIGFEGDVKGIVVPDTSGDSWNGGGIFPYPSGTAPVGKQINGVVIRRIKRDQDGEKSG